MNSKKILFVLFSVVIFLASGLIAYKTAKAGDEFRQTKAADFQNQAEKEQNIQNKILFLIQSDFLAPSEEKKFQIADLYLSLNQFEKAENYLKMVKNESGYYKYAEAALETRNYKIAKVYIDKITNRDVKNELIVFADFSGGSEERLADLPQNPITALGALVRAINTNDFVNNSSKSLLGQKVSEIIAKTSGKTNQTLEIAEMFAEEDQPHLARFMLARLEKEHSGLKDLYLIWARSYEKEKNYAKALEYAKKAIVVDPSDLNSYKIALSYASKAGNDTERNYLADQIKYLEKIQDPRTCTTCGV